MFQITPAEEVKLCPSCRSRESVRWGKTTAGFDTVLGGKVYHQPEFGVLVCTRCALYYKSHVVGRQDLSDYYRRVDYSIWEVDGLYPTEKLVLQQLESLPPASRILDYGCSTGRLLAKLVGTHRCFGIEINRESAEVAAARGVQLVSGVEAEELDRYPLDAVLLIDMFEHLAHPTDTLAQLASRLRDGGLLIVVTGDADSRACQRDRSDFWYFVTPSHLCMMSRRYAEWTSGRLGLKLERWTNVCHYRVKVWDRLMQHARHFTYWQFHGPRRRIPRAVLSHIPRVRRAELWQRPPALTCTRDHAVVMFRKGVGQDVQ